VLSVPPSPFFQAIGVTALQRKVSALENALYWQTRTMLHQTVTQRLPPRTVYGTLIGLDTSGRIVVSEARDGGFVFERVALADAKITNLYEVAARIGTLRYEDAKIEIYQDESAVIWVRGVPINVSLIEHGLAEPDPHPPTNIVDAAFAAYYWARFKGPSV
jgi:hypothetical protein